MKMKNRSIFFPLALIAAGSLWLLISSGRLPAENLWALARFWPFLLIAAGLGLILRSYWAPARLIVDVLVVGGAVAAILFAPQLGWTTPQWDMGFTNNFEGGGMSGSGNVVTESRKVQGITAVSIEFPAEVLIQQGSTESVRIEAEDNLLVQLGSNVEQGTLVIRNTENNWNKRVRPTKTVHITIMVKDLEQIDLSSAGTVNVEALETKALTINLSGTGSMTIDKLSTARLDLSLSGVGSITAKGTASDIHLAISGLGSLDGADLVSKSAQAQLSGAGSAILRTSDSLDAEISGTGSIKYYGSPSIHQQVSGLGSVDKIGE